MPPPPPRDQLLVRVVSVTVTGPAPASPMPPPKGPVPLPLPLGSLLLLPVRVRPAMFTAPLVVDGITMTGRGCPPALMVVLAAPAPIRLKAVSYTHLRAHETRH